MYPSNPSEYQKSPPPTEPPPEFDQYAQPPPPPPPLPPSQSYGQNATGVPVQSTAPGQWSTGLCDCCSDVPSCCLTWCCPCITFGRIAEIVDEGSTCVYRSKMRRQYMLPKSPCNDCLVHCCCDTCALCQEYRELQHRGFDMSIGWEGNMERQNGGVAMPPVVHGGMTR